jgi:hypothetical protein
VSIPDNSELRFYNRSEYTADEPSADEAKNI